MESYGDFMVGSLNEKDYLASRTAYHLNLTGPAVSVYSACSTALLAIAQATEAIRSGKCEMAIAGASSIKSPAISGHIHEDGSVLSKDGHVNSFDASATGTIFSDGVGAVLLKNMDQAIADGDRIIAVIKGIGINNDGGEKGSFSAPSAEGQAGAVYSAILDAGVDLEEITYLEAHATATPIGDPIEVEGLKLAFEQATKKQYCALGSIKSNIGHLNAAAGIAGFFRALLSLKYKQYFPQRAFHEVNPNIEIKDGPFYINTELKPWNTDHKRIAGVSSLGVGGTNVHVILEEAPEIEKGEYEKEEHPSYIISWSAKSEESLELYALKLLDFIKSKPDVDLSRLANSLQQQRIDYKFRRFLVANSREELILKLSEATNKSTPVNVTNEHVFLFPGQGAQFLNMGKELYEFNATFRNAVIECADILSLHMDRSILDIIYPAEENEAAEQILKDTQYTQPAIFTVEYALSQLWISLGVKPILLCGHSIGEFVAAHLSGIMSLEDALKLVAIRGKIISSLPQGNMLSVRCTEGHLLDILPKSLSLAGINGSNQCVVSGEIPEVEAFANFLEKMDIPSKILKTSHAFHSKMMEPILDEFSKVVQGISLNKPKIPMVSTVTGNFITDEAAQSPEYWTKQLRNPVRFADAVTTISKLDIPILFLEVGPGNVLTALSRQSPFAMGKVMYNSLVRNSKIPDYHFFLQTVGNLWQNGRKIHWENLYRNPILIMEVPTYVFKKERIWMEPLQVKNIDNSSTHSSISPGQINSINSQNPTTLNRKLKIKQRVIGLIQETTGLSVSHEPASFLELGFDSLLLTQLASSLKKEFKIPISFRQLSESISDLVELVDYLDQQLPEEEFNEKKVAGGVDSDLGNLVAQKNHQNGDTVSSTLFNHEEQQPMPLPKTIEAALHMPASHLELISRQLELLSQQIRIINNGVEINASTQRINEHPKPKSNAVPGLSTCTKYNDISNSNEEAMEKAGLPKTYEAMAKIQKSPLDVTSEQDAFLQNLIKEDKEIQLILERKTKRISDTLNIFFEKNELPLFITNCGSMWKLNHKDELAIPSILFILLRKKGIQIFDGFPSYLYSEATESEIDNIITHIINTVEILLEEGFLKEKGNISIQKNLDNFIVSKDNPPIPGAKLGKDKSGNPAWFVLDENKPGNYLKVNWEI